MPIQSDLKQEIEAVLTCSSLTEEDKRLWSERLNAVSATYGHMFLNLFSEDQSDLPKETERLKAKIAAKDNPEKLDKISEDEWAELISTLSPSVTA